MESININGLLNRGNVVVPEIQREYVWGAKNNDGVLKRVLGDINETYQAGNGIIDKNLGFLYSYQSKNNDLYLIDGQQRFTTLVLIAFCLAVKEGIESINTFKEVFSVDNSRMAFTFRVRTETEIFLSNLFSRCNDLETLKTINDQIWFPDYYSMDVTINNMVNAIKVILSGLESSTITYHYIMNNVKFWYFDVKDTSQGEELYITMNSRGQNLETSEKQKPLLLDYARNAKSQPQMNNDGHSISWGKAWDEWEESFYELYEKSDNKDISMIELALSRLIRISIEIHTGSENRQSELPVGVDLLPVIEQNFNTLMTIFEIFPELCAEFLDLNEGYKPYQVHQSLIVAFNKGCRGRDLHRVYNVIRNGCMRGIIKHESLLAFLNGFKTTNKQFYEYCCEFYDDDQNKEDAVNTFSKHEIQKIRMFNATSSDRLEDIIWEAQQDASLEGDLRCLWPEKFNDDDSIKQRLSEEDIDKLESRWKAFRSIFNEKTINRDMSVESVEGTIDNALITRSLLSLNWNYSGIHIREKQYAFGWGMYWKKILAQGDYHKTIAEMLDIIDAGYKAGQTVYQSLNKIINTHIDEKKSKDIRYYIVKYPYSLQAMKGGHSLLSIDIDNWDDYEVDILNGDNAHADYIKMFMLMVYRLLATDSHRRGIANELGYWIYSENNHLQLDYKNSLGWIIVWDKDHQPDVERLRNHFARYMPAPYIDKSKKFISWADIPIEKDLIEEGAKIAELIYSYKE